MVIKHRLGPVFQLLPLYAAFFVSVIATTLSVGTYKSAQFVQLENPIRVSPYIKSIRFVGLRSWKFCALEYQAIDTFIDQYSANDGEDIAIEEVELRSHVLRTTDLQTNTTTYVSTTYHFTPQWMETPSHDDILVPADYPNNDDDSLLASFAEELFSCHLLNFDSKSIANDPLWLLARVFFMAGTMVGTIATILVSCLLLIRVKNIDDRRIHLNNSLNGRRSSGIELTLSASEDRDDQLTFVEKEMLELDTDTSGCRQISICFLVSYLLQCLTLMFLNGKVCVNQRCILASGARSLIASCILWVVSALLLILMIKIGRRNQTKIRHLRKEISRLKSLQKEARDNEDNDIMDLSLARTDSETSDTTFNDVEA